MKSSADILFLVFIAGAMFKVLTSTGAIENGIGILVRKFHRKEKSGTTMIYIMTFVFGLLGAVVGYENNIPFVPIGVMIALALGYDLMVGVALILGSVSVGFATSPINPYTVGTSDFIAELPLFSGMGLRTAFCIVSVAVLAHHISQYAKKVKENPQKSLVKGISTEGFEFTQDINSYKLTSIHKKILTLFVVLVIVIVFGVVKFHWYLTEMSALFVITGIIARIIAKYDSTKIVKIMIEGAAELTLGALVIGLARGIQIVLMQGNIGDTIIYTLATPLQHLPVLASAILMSITHGIINFFIPSGSGQAMTTMPIMIPLSDLVGMTRQTAILAFQIGDGIMNLVVPTLGGLLAMLAMAKVPFEKWVRFITPLVAKEVLVGWIFITIAVLTNWS
ncbi:YfcC family protein [Lutibacter sp. B2]|nr:YfcC family protein [Lutibacter sp. B2]